MEKNKISGKSLRKAVNASVQEALEKLELPKASKKLNKLVNRSSRKIAKAYKALIKKESKRKKQIEKSLTYVEDVLTGKKKAKKLSKGSSKVRQVEISSPAHL